MTTSPAHQEAGGGPLEAIAALERELNERLTEARTKAEQLIDRAGREARSGLDEAQSSLPTVCEQLRETSLEEYRRRAEQFRGSWKEERARLLARADDSLPKAVGRLVASFLETLGGQPP